MIQIRNNVFETNSSSTNSLVMCTKSDYVEFAKGTKYYVDCYNAPEKFMTFEDIIEWMTDTNKLDSDAVEELRSMYTKKDLDGVADYLRDYDIYTADTYDDNDYEDFYEEFTTPGGETVVTFGYYGYSG